MMFLPIEQPSSKTLAFAAAVGFKPIMRAHASGGLGKCFGFVHQIII